MSLANHALLFDKSADGCAKTPLLDLLRSVPADARVSYEHSPTDYSMIPAGRLCAEAADEIERLRAYGEACALAERERCIAMCRVVMEHHQAQPDCAPEDEEPTFRDGEACGAEDCIEAIQGPGDWPGTPPKEQA